MLKERELVMLPVYEKARIENICMTSEGKLIKCDAHTAKNMSGVLQHLYFLDDGTIREYMLPCWCINKNRDTLLFISENDENAVDCNAWTKVIASTDDLTVPFRDFIGSYTVPSPTKRFVTKFCKEYNKGNQIKFVKIEFNEPVCQCDTFEKVINCKFAGPDESCCKPNPYNDFYGIHPKINSKNNSITIRPVKSSWSFEELQNLFLSYSDNPIAMVIWNDIQNL